jgi:hypothetical protein
MSEHLHNTNQIGFDFDKMYNDAQDKIDSALLQLESIIEGCALIQVAELCRLRDTLDGSVSVKPLPPTGDKGFEAVEK